MPANLRSYQIRLEDIRFRGKHGVSASERSLPQDFSVSVEVSLPVGHLPGADKIREVFDYDRLASLVVAEGTGQPCKLLETLARRVIDRILTDTPATDVAVTVTKWRPPTTDSVESVSVRLRARRSGAGARGR
ncbi:MAG TPA: dihydroneopterin aldolase [Polyangiaceae bacterium]|nr:dihydroneopterin aldolase [Polyangiaceae bacterium]